MFWCDVLVYVYMYMDVNNSMSCVIKLQLEVGFMSLWLSCCYVSCVSLLLSRIIIVNNATS